MDQSNLYYGVLATQDPTSLCEITQTRKEGINRLKNERFCKRKFIGTEVNNICFCLWCFITTTYKKDCTFYIVIIKSFNEY